jgi:ATP-binding cassette subfamily G (WHITE) protein 2 (SNQ2)
VPTTAKDFADAYNKSDIAKRMHDELDRHLEDETLKHDTEDAQRSIQAQKSKFAIKAFPQRVSYGTQVKAALIRDYQQRWGDQW